MKKVTLFVTLMFAMELVEGEMLETPMNEQRATKLKPQINGIPIRQFQNQTNKKPAIIGESPAFENQFPWMAAVVSVGFPPNFIERLQCGGAVISRNFVLTAAHCILESRTYNVYMGTVDWTDVFTRDTFSIASVIKHPRYNDVELTNDICLLLLDTTIPFSAINSGRVKSIRLPRRIQASTSFSGVLGIVSGWGPTEDDGEVSSTLNYASLGIISNSACASFWGRLPATNLCTSGATNKNVCGADGGSPLTIREAGTARTLVGIVSFVADSCYGAPAVYTRTSKYLSWISANTDVQIRP